MNSRNLILAGARIRAVDRAAAPCFDAFSAMLYAVRSQISKRRCDLEMTDANRFDAHEAAAGGVGGDGIVGEDEASEALKVLKAIRDCRTAALGGHLTGVADAAIRPSRITRVETGTAQSARPAPVNNGSRSGRKTCFRCRSSTLSSRCHMNCLLWRCRTRKLFTAFCSEPLRKGSWRSPPNLDHALCFSIIPASKHLKGH